MFDLSVLERAPGSTTARLHVCLLGPPSISWDDTPWRLLRRQARALLFYLTAIPKPVARDHLCLLLWPDLIETTARCNLSRLVSILHSGLPDPTVLITSDNQIGLTQPGVRSDLRAFEQLWSAWKIGGQPSCLEQAVALYRGPFLDGFSLPDSPEYEAWITMERQRWERLMLQALRALVENLAAVGEYASAIAYAQRYQEIDDLNEEVHRCLMELYASIGDRSAAARQYERLVAILERELGLDPLPETQAIYRAVQSGGTPQQILPPPSSLRAGVPGGDVPLVGREDAWHALEEAYGRVRGGRGQIVLISGEAGIGKSRLMQDFCSSVQHPCILLTGAGYPETKTSPYQPIVEALRSRLSMEMFSFSAYPSWLAEAACLLPELRALHPGLPELPASEPGWARARLFESLDMILASMAARMRPVLLCLDDLHWADPATLDWLAYMGHHLASRKLLILGAYRSEEMAAVAELRHRLERHGILQEIPLGGLDEQAICRLLCHFDAGFCDRVALAGRMCQATGGNPFFLLEIARALIESHPHPGHTLRADGVALPDSVRAAVQARMGRLTPTARHVLEAAAVLGTVFAFEAVRMTSGRQENETVEILEELLSQQLVVACNGGYRFRHGLVREVIYLDLSFHRRRLLHRRAGETLAKLCPVDAVALARHFELAD